MKMRPIVEEKEIITKTKSATLPPLKPATDKNLDVSGKPVVRHASAAEFEKAHRKVSALHAGLFRRLAK